jgi:putative ABC transport system permease protein
MKPWRVAAKRLAGLFGRDRHDADLREELDSLAALQLDEQIGAGVDPAEARRRMLARRGSVTAVQEAVREQRVLGWLDTLWRDVRVGVRMLRRNPVFASIGIVSLGLGIGVNTAIFSIVDHLLLRSLPVQHASRLTLLSWTDAGRERGQLGGDYTYPIYDAFRSHAALFDAVGAFSEPNRMTVRAGGATARPEVLYVSGGFFELMGVAPLIGRTLAATDDVRGGGADGPVAVVSARYFERALGGDVAALARPIEIEGIPFTVVGVMPPSYFGPEVGRGFDLMIPFGTEPLISGEGSSLDARSNWWIKVMVRLKEGQSAAAATRELQRVQPQIREVSIPDRYPPEEKVTFLKDPLWLVPAAQGTSGLRARYRDALMILMAVVGAILLITCANMANLLLARATARRAEMSLRLSLGASRSRLVGQMLVESWLLAVGGAIVGLFFALWTARLIVSQLSTVRVPYTMEVSLDWRVLLFTAAVAGLVTPLFGIVPALRATRVSPGEALKEQNRSIAGQSAPALTQALIVGQVAMSLALVVVAGLLIRTFTGLTSQPLGFDAGRVVVGNVTLARDAVAPEQRGETYERLRRAVAAVPGVERTSASVISPLSGRGWNWVVGSVDGRALGGGGRDRLTWSNAVSPDYFATHGTRLVAGRDLLATDTIGAPKVIVVNQAFVRRYVTEGNPIGRVIRGDRDDTPGSTIVGVVEDAQYRNAREAPPPIMYAPLAQIAELPSNITISARSTVPRPNGLEQPIAQALESAGVPLATETVTLSRQVESTMVQERLLAILAGLFGALALAIAGIGLYGVTAYAVSRRRGEIGVRLALGATPHSVLTLVLGRVAILVLAGVTLGCVGALYASRAVKVLLYGLEPNDPATLAGAVLVLLLTGGLAGAVPAWRAARTDPAAAIRQ